MGRGKLFGEDMRCDECKIVDTSKYKHAPFCSQQRDMDYIKENYRSLSERYWKEQVAQGVRIKSMAKEIERWQGKYHIVKAENNALRRKQCKN